MCNEIYITNTIKKKYPKNIKLAQKEVTPPFIPSFDPGDNEFTSNFDPQFTREPAYLTPDDS